MKIKAVKNEEKQVCPTYKERQKSKKSFVHFLLEYKKAGLLGLILLIESIKEKVFASGDSISDGYTITVMGDPPSPSIILDSIKIYKFGEAVSFIIIIIFTMIYFIKKRKLKKDNILNDEAFRKIKKYKILALIFLVIWLLITFLIMCIDNYL